MKPQPWEETRRRSLLDPTRVVVERSADRRRLDGEMHHWRLAEALRLRSLRRRRRHRWSGLFGARVADVESARMDGTCLYARLLR